MKSLLRSFGLLPLAALSLASVLLARAADFEAPPAPFQTVPRPADGETVSANPPCFVFPARKVFDNYVVEFGSNAEFAAGTTTRMSSPYMLVVAPEPLKPNRYFWRWRPGRWDDGGGGWSPVRSFVVPADAPVVPLPDIAALAKRLGVSRPRVMVWADEVPELRRRALARFGQEWLVGVRQTAEQMRGKTLLPEPALLPPLSDPRRKILYLETFQTTRPFFKELRVLAENYLLTGDELSGQEAKRRLLHIIGWDPHGSTRLSHNDEVATEVVRYCPVAFDRVYALLSVEEKRRCLDVLVVRMHQIRDVWKRSPFEKNPYRSHDMGYFVPDLLQACVALAGEAPVEEMLRYTMLQLWSPFYPPFGGDDGGWSEGPSYWTWIAAAFARTYLLVEHATGVPVRLRSNLRQQSFFKLYGNPPYSPMSPFGDNQENPPAGGTMAMLAALYDDPYAKWYAENQQTRFAGLDALLFDDSRVTAMPPSDLPQGRAFFDVGLAAMHTALADGANNVSLLFRSSPFGSTSHSYADQNTFVLNAFGEALVIASGYYQSAYGSPHHVEWTRQTRASNSVLVNGEGQPRGWDSQGLLTAFHTTRAADYAIGDAAPAYPGNLERYDRHIIFLRPAHTGGAPIIVIRDELRASRPATFQFLLHALNRMNVNSGAQRVDLAQGKARCRVDYLAPGGLTFDQNDRFPKQPFRPAPNQWHLVASTVGPEREATSLIVLQPHRAADVLLVPRMISGDGCVGVEMTGDGRTVTVHFRTGRAASTVGVGRITTDAQAASVTTIGGKPHSAVMFLGQQITWDHRTLLESAAPESLSASALALPAPPYE